MKARLPLYLVIAAVLLLSTVALPVMADEDPTSMWVSRVRLAYNGRSSSSPDRIVGKVHVRDANLDNVDGAAVTAEWTLPDGSVFQETALTAFQGVAQFTVWEGKGVYKLCVVDVVKDGWLYDPALNVETCATFGGLSPSEKEALGLALDDEYQAWATYVRVLADLGPILPFTKIVTSEETHINELVALFNRYRLEVPPNPWPGNVPSFDSRPEACAAGVQIETENVALYDQLLGTVDNRDLIRVFTALQTASLTKHLPAFERCAP